MWDFVTLGAVVATAVCAICTFLAIFIYKFGLYDLFVHRVDVTSRRNGGEHVAAVLKEHGVKFMFTLIGGHISSVLVECEKIGIRVIDTRHEVTCVFAADAVARLSGVVGVACVTAGPGLTNTVTAVKNASMAESPILLLGGASATILKGRGALQDIDQLALFRPLCKYVATIRRIRDIVPTLKEAIRVAQSGTPGPVFVELPIDTLYPYNLVMKEIVSADKPAKSLSMKLVRLYLNNYVNQLFAGAWEPVDPSPLKVTFPMPSSGSVRKCVSLLRTAKKPVILLGSQATLPPMKPEDVQAALQKIGAPCFLGGMSRGYLGKNSPLHIRQKRSLALKEADVVICAGAVADFRLSYGRHFNSRSKVVSVNRSVSNMKLNADTNWKAYMYVHADPGSFLVDLAEEVGDFRCDQAWPQELKQRDEEKEVANLKKAQELPEHHLNPLNVLYSADKALSEDSILVADGGDFVGSAAYILRPCGPLKWLDPGAFGTLGVGGGFALGAKLVNPDSDVWIIYGDGSLGYSVAEFDTFKRHQVPVIALVGNDACWTQIAREQVPMFHSRVACDLSYCDYDIVAQGFGGEGFKLDRSCSKDKIDAVMEEAKKVSRTGTPVLINCLIGKSNFRDGSIAV
jgi:acetolactate synthase-like protein